MPWEYSDNEFVKINRKIVNWGWYSDPCTRSVFIHCLIIANWKPGVWHGIHYDRGELITSLPSLAKTLGISERNVRTAINHLISTGELTSRMTDKVTGKKLTKNRILTVLNYDKYQVTDRQTDRQTTGKRQASDSRYKKYRSIEGKKEKENMQVPSEQETTAASDDWVDDPGMDPDEAWKLWKANGESFDGIV